MERGQEKVDVVEGTMPGGPSVTSDTNGSSMGKRLSLARWRNNSKDKEKGKGVQDDKGKFVENISEGGGEVGATPVNTTGSVNKSGTLKKRNSKSVGK